MEFTGKSALITGSTGGIGGETARLMAAAGADVIVSGRNEERGEALVKEILAGGGSARFVRAELTDVGAVVRLAEAAGEVDVLVNNAATWPGAATVDQDVASFDDALATNLRAPYFLTAKLAPAMVAKGAGSIVNVSTMVARIGMAGLSVYSATKAALESLTRTWAAEFGPAGVRVNAVSPGPTRTDMVINTVGEEGAQRFADTTVLRRLASAREIAEVICFLAGDKASYMTGALVPVDAGRTAI